ncbi:hypothetical protein GCM10009801_75500 [Streptomyces albiaxialis]|uniref:DUF4178 domain-containing protein n=1 Tax=Streptomyces albiaxialis TaxID=329523 RepID=A0ABN2X1H2_9ACTN
MGLLRLLFKRSYAKRPPEGVDPCSSEEVRAALLGLNGPDVPWAVRDGTPEGADLVAEWRLAEPAGRNFFIRHQLDRTLTIRMRLSAEEREVHAIEEQREVTWAGDPPRAQVGRQWSRGPARTVSKKWAIERGPDGRRRLRESFSFDSADMKQPVQDVVLKAGWAWRSVVPKDF